MQYTDWRRASATRAVIRAVFAALGIVTAFAFVGDEMAFSSLRWGLLAFFMGLLLMVWAGGLCEVRIIADDSYVEISCQQIFNRKGRMRTYSIDADRLIRWKRTSFLFFHFLKVDYVGHGGRRKSANVGFTLVPPKVRRGLFRHLSHIEERNNSTTSI